MQRLPFAIVVTLAATLPAAAAPLSSAFTYQGQLRDGGQPANGLYDLQFCLFDTSSNPIPLGCAPDAGDVPVQSGLFTVDLDFGSAVFSGQERYLEIRVRPGASTGSYTPLSPRQLVHPAPESTHAAGAGSAPWSGLTGVPAGFADGIDDVGGSGTVTSVSSGTGLTGGPITGSGTLAVDTAVIQARVTGTCTVGQKVLAVNADGTVVCATDAVGSGTVTSVASGAGLTGGPITGSGSLSIANGGVGAAQIASGAVGLAQINTAQVQARVSGTCALGEYLRGINADGSLVCSIVPAAQRITALITSGTAGQSSSIAIGTDGLPVVSYYDGTNGFLKVAHCTDVACTGTSSITAVDTAGNVGQSTSIAIGNDGLPVMSYADSTNGDLKVAHCANAACTGTNAIAALDTAGSVGYDTSIAIGTDGLAVVSYYDGTNGDLKVAHCVNTVCTSATVTAVDTAGNVGQNTSIAIGSDGLPVVSYLDSTNGDLKVAHCANATCTGTNTITAVDTVGSVGFNTSNAIGNDGLPVVSYRDYTNADLKVAHCANAACTSATITTVDTAGNVGYYTSIAIGIDGLPAVSYYEGANGDLKVAHCTDAACTSATVSAVDTANNVGQYTSIAIGNDGLPVVSYYDATNGDLKVVKCNNRFCQ